MLTTAFMEQFCLEWVNSWNDHNLESILSHYSDSIEFTSPFVIKVLGISDGTLRGKNSLREYFQKGLSFIPNLKFTYEYATLGVNSITVIYRNTTGILSAETMVIGPDGKVIKAMAQYVPESSTK